MRRLYSDDPSAFYQLHSADPVEARSAAPSPAASAR
jgi:hypothetical protein